MIKRQLLKNNFYCSCLHLNDSYLILIGSALNPLIWFLLKYFQIRTSPMILLKVTISRSDGNIWRTNEHLAAYLALS